MFLINPAMESISIGTAALIVVLGMAVVFFGLILLMYVTKIAGAIISRKKAAEPAPAPAAAAPAGRRPHHRRGHRPPGGGRPLPGLRHLHLAQLRVRALLNRLRCERLHEG